MKGDLEGRGYFPAAVIMTGWAPLIKYIDSSWTKS